MYEPGSPSSPLATMNLCSPTASRVNCHLVPAGNPAPPRPRTPASLTSSSSSSGVSSFSACPSPDQSPSRISTGSSKMLCHSGSGAAWAPLFRTRSIASAPASITSPSRTAGEEWQKPRQIVSASENSPSSERSPRLMPVACGELGDVLIAGCREAGRSGADTHVTLAAGLDQVVVERRDAVHRRLGQAGLRGGPAAVLVGDLAVVVDGRLEDLERGRRIDAVVSADEFDEVARHGSAEYGGSQVFVQVCPQRSRHLGGWFRAQLRRAQRGLDSGQ